MIEYSLIRSDRKTIQIMVSKGEVCVRAPKSASIKRIEDFIKFKSEWIQRSIAKQLDNLAKLDTSKTLLFDIEVTENATAREVLNREVRYLLDRAQDLAAQFGLHPDSIKTSNARTYWGICNSKNRIRLNWRLLALPRELIDYVIMHELLHTVHRNHSKDFWNALRKIMPDCKIRRQQLKEYAWVLSAYQ